MTMLITAGHTFLATSMIGEFSIYLYNITTHLLSPARSCGMLMPLQLNKVSSIFMQSSAEPRLGFALRRHIRFLRKAPRIRERRYALLALRSRCARFQRFRHIPYILACGLVQKTVGI